MTGSPQKIPANARQHAALAGLPPAAAAAVVAADRALQARNPDAAERQLTAALALAPNHPEVLHILGNAQAQRGQPEAAVATLRAAAAQRPQDARILNSLGLALGHAARPDDAIAALDEACRLAPKLGGAWFNLGLLHAGLGEYEAAAAALRKALAIDPANANARTLLADFLRHDGDIDAAEREYRAVLARQPLAGMAWLGLAEIKTRPLQAADAAQMRRAQADARTGEHDRVAMGFALGKALEDLGDYAGAFAALQDANERARPRKPAWNAAAFSAGVDRMLATFAPPRADDPDFGSEAIFIVSLPRSGSTLTEQILAAHPQVEGASELNDLWIVLQEESQRRRQPFEQWAAQAGAGDWRRLGARYLERTARWRRTRPRFTDKLPGNWQFAGAIMAMLPGARIIACRRDPLETCFSCWRQMLNGNEYTHRFDDLAAYWRDFDRAVRHWHGIAPQRVREQVYEELIADPEAQTRALLEFCGLPFDAACLRFHESVRRVRTPSAAQVREPLRRDTARGDRYGALLDPLRRALGLPAYAAPA